MTLPVIHRVTTVDLRFVRHFPWPFAVEARRADIDAHFKAQPGAREAAVVERPRVCSSRNPDCSAGDRLQRQMPFETSISQVFWPGATGSFPDTGDIRRFRHGGTASVPTAPFVLGEMGAAELPPPAGFIFRRARLTSDDVAGDGKVDIAASVAREVLKRKTGLTPDGLSRRCALGLRGRSGPADCDVCGYCMSTSPGEALRAKHRGQPCKLQHQPELSAIHLVRGVADLTAAMPRFVTAFIEAQVP